MSLISKNKDVSAEDISVVICTRNRGALIQATLESILHGEVLPKEIVVIDQSDDVLTKSSVTALCAVAAERSVSLRYIRTETRGLSRARNIGVQEAACDVLLFTDDDVIVERDWVKLVAAEFQRYSDLQIMYGSVLLPASYDYRTEFIPHTFVPTLRPVGLFHPAALSGIGANMALRRTLLEKVGQFNEQLGAGSPVPCAEDFDMSLRALTHSAGLRVHLLDEARVIHHAGARKGEAYKTFTHITGYGIGQFWHYSIHSAKDIRTRTLCTLKFVQEQGLQWAKFVNEMAQGKRPTGIATYGYQLRGFANGITEKKH